MDHLINKIHNADCFDILKQIPDNSIDLVLTDPPYMTTDLEYDKMASKTLDLTKWFNEIVRVAKINAPILIFSSGKFTYQMVNIGYKYFRYELIWDKVNKITGALNANNRPLLNHEFILYFSKSFARNRNQAKLPSNTYNHGVELSYNNCRKAEYTIKLYNVKRVEYKKLNDRQYPKSILRYNKPSNKSHIHPSEKPFLLIQYLILLYSNPNDIVLDTFSGSAVVAHASIVNERKFIAVELDIDFYNKSQQRLKECLFVDCLLNGNI